MRARDIFGYCLQNLKRRKLRSWLTVIGILLGIATIVVLVSIGEGVGQQINSNLNSLGADTIVITPGGGRAMGPDVQTDSDYGKLHEKDATRIKGIMDIAGTAMSVSGRETVGFAKKDYKASITAVEDNLFVLFPETYALSEGRYLQDSDQKVAVIGYGVANEMFGSEKVGINSYILINGEKYRVIGILAQSGETMSGGGDRAIYVPYSQKDSLFGKDIGKNEIGQITVKVKTGVDSATVGAAITQALALARGVDADNPDFTVTTASTSTRQNISSISATLTMALLLIGLISATVGGIGIANTMFMTVIERTKEIGILKSIGATSSQILALFVVEAGMIGMIGGLAGLLLGIIVIQIIPNFVSLTPYLRPEVAAGAVLFATVVGIVAGAIPARNASRIPAIEALSYD